MERNCDTCRHLNRAERQYPCCTSDIKTWYKHWEPDGNSLEAAFWYAGKALVEVITDYTEFLRQKGYEVKEEDMLAFIEKFGEIGEV